MNLFPHQPLDPWNYEGFPETCGSNPITPRNQGTVGSHGTNLCQLPTTIPRPTTAMTTFLLAFFAFVPGYWHVFVRRFFAKRVLQKSSPSKRLREKSVEKKNTSKDLHGLCCARVYTYILIYIPDRSKRVPNDSIYHLFRLNWHPEWVPVLVSNRHLVMHSWWAGCCSWQAVVVFVPRFAWKIRGA